MIQEGTELIYPLSAMGAHVSDCPNHIAGRNKTDAGADDDVICTQNSGHIFIS